jgi:hypothetical protein
MRNILEYIRGLDDGVGTGVSKGKGKGKVRPRTGHKDHRESNLVTLLFL